MTTGLHLSRLLLAVAIALLWSWRRSLFSNTDSNRLDLRSRAPIHSSTLRGIASLFN